MSIVVEWSVWTYPTVQQCYTLWKCGCIMSRCTSFSCRLGFYKLGSIPGHLEQIWNSWTFYKYAWVNVAKHLFKLHERNAVQNLTSHFLIELLSEYNYESVWRLQEQKLVLLTAVVHFRDFSEYLFSSVWTEHSSCSSMQHLVPLTLEYFYTPLNYSLH